MPYLQQQEDGTVALTVYVQPRASKTRFTGQHGEALKLCITAPPVEGKANAAVIAYLARLFRIPKSAVTIKSGTQGRTKTLIINHLDFSDARRLLDKALL